MPSDRFRAMFPLSCALGLEPVNTGSGDHVGFDCDDVKTCLGPDRYTALMAGVKEVFSCGHRVQPPDHPQAGYEAHCIWAKDLEAFLGAS